MKIGGVTPGAMYIGADAVSKIYLGSTMIWGGSGDDSGGEDVGELPAGYTRCLYLESSGRQYIDTLHNPSGTDRVEIDFVDPYVYEEYANTFFGCSDRTNDVYIETYEGKLGYVWGKTESAIMNAIANTPYNCVIDGANGDVLVDGVKKETFVPSNFQFDISAVLFGWRSITNSSNIFGSDVRIYSCSITNGSDEIRKFVSCLDEHGVPCMYDMVTRQPFYNLGTGKFGYELMNGTYVAPV